MKLRNQRCQSELRGRGLEGGSLWYKLNIAPAPPFFCCFFFPTLRSQTLWIACFASLLQRSLPPHPPIRFSHVWLYPWVGGRWIPVHHCYWTVNTAGLQLVKDAALRPIGGGTEARVCNRGGGYWCKNTLTAEKSVSRIPCCPHGFPPD